MENLNEIEQLQLAQKKHARKKSFIGNMLSYFVVNNVFIVLYFLFDNRKFWPIWPIIGWGFAVLLHGIWIYILSKNTRITMLKK